ncbi:hypothetical protein [Anaerosalibacter sp. Marseille-P3206]|uniref:hypothetical protein n=1 Tax=Anaerosalibacter sp. Marseille-P3206 TaxID=1871005 RepID=UPI00098468C0|nr:hypothetical protein [Anaerosalibacter sp. Marseille-P3206]
MIGIKMFLLIIFMIPVYALLIYGIKDPEDMATFGERWKYRENIYPTEDYIKYIKISSIITTIIITLILIFTILSWFNE